MGVGTLPEQSLVILKGMRHFLEAIALQRMIGFVIQSQIQCQSGSERINLQSLKDVQGLHCKPGVLQTEKSTHFNLLSDQ